RLSRSEEKSSRKRRSAGFDDAHINYPKRDALVILNHKLSVDFLTFVSPSRVKKIRNTITYWITNLAGVKRSELFSTQHQGPGKYPVPKIIYIDWIFRYNGKRIGT